MKTFFFYILYQFFRSEKLTWFSLFQFVIIAVLHVNRVHPFLFFCCLILNTFYLVYLIFFLFSLFYHREEHFSIMGFWSFSFLMLLFCCWFFFICVVYSDLYNTFLFLYK